MSRGGRENYSLYEATHAHAGMFGLAYVYAEIGMIPFLSCFRKGDREVPKGGLQLITRWVPPLHRLLSLLEQVQISMKEA